MCGPALTSIPVLLSIVLEPQQEKSPRDIEMGSRSGSAIVSYKVWTRHFGFLGPTSDLKKW